MRYLKFEIVNYKGIQNVVLDLDSGPISRIFTLVGLNESGKTTVLEALSFFNANVGNRTELSLTPNVCDDIHSLIPKQSKDNFNGTISIRAKIAIDGIDISHIKSELDKIGFTLVTCASSMALKHEYTFVNSRFSNKMTYWDIKAECRKKGTRGKAKQLGPQSDAWTPAFEIVTKLIPSIIYYPNFLFDFPDKIYLESSENESKEQNFYRQLLQDMLDGLNNNQNIATHILDRVKSGKSEDRDSLESTLSKLSGYVSRTVFNREFNIFNQVKTRSIVIGFPKQESPEGRYYVEIKLRDGEDSYYIRERSLGFKWFFIFLLFTRLRAGRKAAARDLIFLFDEPASNLHSTAQQKILCALDGLTKTTTSSVIYSTHSHHLINPKWLETTYIVKNQGLDYDNDEGFTSVKTNIVVEKYRAFVGKYPTQRNYFQPVLDILDYRPSNLEDVPSVVMLEGKNDYYGYTYFQDIKFKRPNLLQLMPGVSCSSFDYLIQLYLAWGREFFILLDSDAEGKKQKKRYLDEFGYKVEGKIFTYKDINSAWTDMTFESLIGVDALAIQKSSFPTVTEVNKGQLYQALQYLLINKMDVPVGKSTLERIATVFAFLDDKMAGDKILK